MYVPLSWLRDYVDFDLDAEALAERLTVLGMEVKGIRRRGEDWQDVVVGELLEVEPAPGTEHLSLTKVRVADDGPILSIVCGATNIMPGQRVPVALPGAVLPGNRQIEITRIAGHHSEGMLCSGDELRITTDADGILILPDDTALGGRLVDLYGDDVLDVDVKPNRGDCLSLIGLAREVAAITGGRVRWPEMTLREEGSPASAHVAVDVRDATLCPRFVARYVDRVVIAPAPLDVQVRLTAAGMRPISNVVDASNYVMLEMGKPTHTFDAAAVAEGRIVVRTALPGERLETLDHVERELTPETLLITDPRGPIAIAGVMGGAASEVAETTTAVIIESAVFDPVSIRRTAQRYGLHSEASFRFERGQELRLARLGADRVAQLLATWEGGRVAPGTVDTNPTEPAPTRVPFRPARVSRLLGIDLAATEMRELLARAEVATEPAAPGDTVRIDATSPPIQLDSQGTASALVAIIPAHRRDLEIEADVAEEIARLRGYDTIVGTLPHTPMPEYRPDPRRIVDEVRDLLAGRGLNEIATHGLVSPADHERLGIPAGDPATIRVTNPVSHDHSQLRRSMLPGLVAVLVENERQRRADVGIFEVGSIHDVASGGPREVAVLSILLAGDQGGGTWNAPARPADPWDVFGLVAWLAARLGAPRPVAAPAAALPGVEHPGRTATLGIALPAGRSVELGRVAALDPRYLDTIGSRAEHVVVATLWLAVLQAATPGRTRFLPFARVPLVERDIAVVVPESRPAGEVEAVIRRSAGTLLRSLRLFDVYRGTPLADGELSLAFRLTLQAADRTLTDAEIDGLVAAVVSGLDRELGARIRS
jgi:phenylalanyl-tRNA synthetase beta chain